MNSWKQKLVSAAAAAALLITTTVSGAVMLGASAGDAPSAKTVKVTVATLTEGGETVETGKTFNGQSGYTRLKLVFTDGEDNPKELIYPGSAEAYTSFYAPYMKVNGIELLDVFNGQTGSNVQGGGVTRVGKATAEGTADPNANAMWLYTAANAWCHEFPGGETSVPLHRAGSRK